MAQDWIDDDNLTREEKLARFEALGPEPTRGPNSESPEIPGGLLTRPADSSFGTFVIVAHKFASSYVPRATGTRSTAPSSVPVA